MRRTILANEDLWFDNLSKEQQEDYIEQHPNSKYAKRAKMSKDIKTKIKRDPYKDVPEKDKAAMIEAKTRGFTVPPAWRNVWVNPDPEGDLQVKGKDSKGRTQSLYSINHKNKQDAIKFNRLKSFVTHLPKMNRIIEQDFDTVPEAQLLYLISKTGFRIGSEKDTGAKVQAYGASTLTTEHIKVNGSKISFDFIGKEGVRQVHTLVDKKLANFLKDIPEGQKLFDTNDGKIRRYLDKINGSKTHFKVKDFRTYVATSTALKEIKNIEPPKSEKDLQKKILEVCKVVSKKLGNTPQMARDSYVDPTVFKDWRDALIIQTNSVEQSSDNNDKDIMDFLQTHSYKESVNHHDLLIDHIQTHHYKFPKEVMDLYLTYSKLEKGPERSKLFNSFVMYLKKNNYIELTDDKKNNIAQIISILNLIKTNIRKR